MKARSPLLEYRL